MRMEFSYKSGMSFEGNCKTNKVKIVWEKMS